MIPALVVAVLAAVALAYVAAPMRRGVHTEPIDPSFELEEKKLVALTAILDLENERDVGKLSDEDFVELRSVYEAQALDVLQQLDRANVPTGSDPLEREIARMRERIGDRRCPACGAPRGPGTTTCATCGA